MYNEATQPRHKGGRWYLFIHTQGGDETRYPSPRLPFASSEDQGLAP